jgi:hypothetical protein
MAAAGERINDARRHVTSAPLADNDVTLALSACHDAIRKAITAHMNASGYRPHSGEGAHRIVLDYARHELAGVLTDEDLTASDSIQRRGVLTRDPATPTSTLMRSSGSARTGVSATTASVP